MAKRPQKDLKLAQKGLDKYTRYMPSSQEADYDYGPSWWIVPAIAGGAMGFTLIVLWLAGAL